MALQFKVNKGNESCHYIEVLKAKERIYLQMYPFFYAQKQNLKGKEMDNANL
jgi:hypothetical protein